jgi:hypothetical protein
MNFVTLFSQWIDGDFETGGKRARPKLPTPFARESLRGMWHQHYTDARFMPKIFQGALGGKRLPKFGKILEEELASTIRFTPVSTSPDLRMS